MTTAARLDILPDVPALGEFVTGYEASGWQGIGVPKNTSPEVINRLSNEIKEVVANSQVKARLHDMGVEPVFMGSAEFSKLIAAETEKWAKVIRTANIKPG